MIGNSPSLTLMSAVVRHSLSGFNFQSQIMQDIPDTISPLRFGDSSVLYTVFPQRKLFLV